MIPILFQSTATSFNSHGLGQLSDVCSCTVTEERNGSYELEMTYPITGAHFSDISIRSIILAKANATSQSLQPFRIYRITKPMGGLVTIYAQHISYDLSGAIVAQCSAMSAAGAITAIAQNAIGLSPFTLWTDVVAVGSMVVSKPISVRAQLGGVEGSLLDVYGGEYEFDGFTIKLHASRGANNGVSIRYGKNLLSLEQEENCANCYTAVYPYWSGNVNDQEVIVRGSVISAGTFDYQKIFVLDCSSVFESQPTVEELNAYATSYVAVNHIGVPTVSLTLSFVQLEQCEEYKDKAIFERVALCDTVNVYFDTLGVNATAKVNKTIYNVLLERFDSIDLGDARRTIADTIASQQNAIDNIDFPEQEVTRSMMDEAIENATKLITGNLGGYVVLHSSTGSDEPDEILIMDKPSIEGDDPAQKVWRWNKSGLGYSSNGYAGPYSTAITADGKIVADFITTGTLSANRISGGTITCIDSGNNKYTTVFDMTNGNITLKRDNSDDSSKDYHQYVAMSAASLSALTENKTTAVRTNRLGVGISTTGRGLISSEFFRVYNGSITGNKLVEISPNTSGFGCVTLYGTNGSTVYANLYGNANGGNLTIKNAVGTEMVYAGTSSEGGGIVKVNETDGSIGAAMYANTGYGGQISVYDASGTGICNIGGDSEGYRVSLGGKNMVRYKTSDNKRYLYCDYLNGYTPAYSRRIGTFVYGVPSGDSTYACTYVPLGISGTFQLGSGSRYLSFTIDAEGSVSGAYSYAAYN